MPVLIANGEFSTCLGCIAVPISDDALLPTQSSDLMWKKMANTDAQLHLYPDSGHGFLINTLISSRG